MYNEVPVYGEICDRKAIDNNGRPTGVIKYTWKLHLNSPKYPAVITPLRPLTLFDSHEEVRENAQKYAEEHGFSIRWRKH